MRIESSRGSWVAENANEAMHIIKQIRNSADYDNSGRGYGIRVTVDGTTKTIRNWIRDGIQERR